MKYLIKQEFSNAECITNIAYFLISERQVHSEMLDVLGKNMGYDGVTMERRSFQSGPNSLSF